MALSRVVTCEVCEVQELTTMTELPAGWVKLWEPVVDLCPSCLSTWSSKFGEEPVYYMTGGEEELRLI